MPTIRSNSEERPTCKMTPEQLLGLQKHARAKTVTLTPEIEIVDPANAIPTVIAEGTGQSVPIVFDDLTAEKSIPTEPIVAITNHPDPVGKSFSLERRPGSVGAIVGFVLFGAVTLAETLLAVLS
ncbi:MAG: hypothetical protein QM831_23545 [Kofleriaceae bacterium]